MKKNKSKLSKIFFLGITLLINIKICNAFTITGIGGGGGGNNSNNNSNSTNSMITGNGGKQVGNKQIEYEYKYSVGSSKAVSINAYDMNGESVIPNEPIVDESLYKFKAGTWVGIHAKEIQSSSWNMGDDVEFKEKYNEVTCKYTKQQAKTCSYSYEGECKNNGCSPVKIEGKTRCSCYGQNAHYCNYEEVSTYSTYDVEFHNNSWQCPPKSGWGEGTISDTVPKEKDYSNNGVTTEIINEIKTRLQATAKSIIGNATGQLKYITLKSYPLDQELCKNSPDSCYGTIVGESEKGIQNGPSGDSYGSYYIELDYLQEYVCINAKTSEVTYGEECDEDELRIENSEVYDENLDSTIKYWHYFIPLNMKSTDDFWIEAVTNESNYFSIDECVSIIEELSQNNKSYKGYILPLVGDNTFFDGDYLSYTNPERSNDYRLLQSGGGCKLSAKVRIPVTQEFYNETTNKDGNKKFKGFNFYYKPININNPFPNGLSDTSIWKEWYDNVKDDKKATPDISKSFDEVTYIAENINANKVRKYTKDNPYTSWKNISLSGRSSFIENEGIVTRNENISFYKLGCGPYNSEWSECK